MKRFTKGMLIAAGIFGAAGIGLTIAGGVMGASMSELNGFESISKILWTEKDVVEPGTMEDDALEDIGDMDAVNSVDGRTNAEFMKVESESSADGAVYQLEHQPVELDIELKYDELELEEGDSFSVKVYNDTGNDVTVKESEDVLKIRSTKRTSKARKVCVSYPKDVKFKKLDIEMGAGTVYINCDIQTEELDVEVGAGEFESNGSVTAKKADLQIGTGSMTFADLSAKETDGECGLGELDLTMTGAQEDYNYDLECGVGNLDVGSDSYSGLGREKIISNAGADRKLDLECGMGNVSVSFSGKEHRN